MRPRPLAWLAAGATLLALAGCTAASTPDAGRTPSRSATGVPPATASPSPSPSISTATAAGPSTPVPTSATSGGSTAPAQVAALPAGFPLPRGAHVTRLVRDDRQVAATIRVPATSGGTAAWSSALRAGGYRVTAVHDEGGLGEVRFAGHGCLADSQIALTGRSAAVQCILR